MKYASGETPAIGDLVSVPQGDTDVLIVVGSLRPRAREVGFEILMPLRRVRAVVKASACTLVKRVNGS